MGTSKKSATEETGGRNVKCLIPKCNDVFWTDGSMKQHMTKTHKMTNKLSANITKMTKEVSAIEPKETEMTIKIDSVQGSLDLFDFMRDGGSELTETAMEVDEEGSPALKIVSVHGGVQTYDDNGESSGDQGKFLKDK